MTSREQAILTLGKAVALINQPNCWTQYALARDTEHRRVPVEDESARSFCLAGAVQRAHMDQGLSLEKLRQLMQLLNKICRLRFEKKISRYGSGDDLQEFRVFPLSYANDRLIGHSGDAVRLLHLVGVLLKKVSISGGQAVDVETLRIDETDLSARHVPAYTGEIGEPSQAPTAGETLHIDEYLDTSTPAPEGVTQKAPHLHVDTQLAAPEGKLPRFRLNPDETLGGGEVNLVRQESTAASRPNQEQEQEQETEVLSLDDILRED